MKRILLALLGAVLICAGSAVIAASAQELDENGSSSAV